MARNLVKPHKRMEARRRIEAEIRDRALWGQRLAGEHELADRLGVGRKTVRGALAELELAGMLERRVGAGTFVRLRPGVAGKERGRLARLLVVVREPVEDIPAWIFEGRLLRALTDCAPRLRAECQVLVPGREGDAARLADEASLREFDGFISVSVDDRGLLSRWSELRRGPLVLLDCFVTCLPAVAIVDDGFSGSRAVTRHLVKLGHRRIAFLNCANPGLRNPDKIAGYRAALAEKGLPADPALVREAPADGEGDGQEAFAVQAVGELLALPEPPTAIVGFDDLYALPALRELERRGLAVGADVSVAGQGDGAARQGACDRLTSTRINFEKMAGEALRAAMSGTPASEGRTVIIANRLVARGSTGAPADGK